MSSRLIGSLTVLIFCARAFGQADETQFNSVFGNVSGAPATVTLSGDASAVTTTDSVGNYRFFRIKRGSYVVAPSRPGFTFTPGVASVSVQGNSDVEVNFTATPIPTPTEPIPTDPTPPPSVQHNVSLSWTPSTTPNPTGYNIYRATTSTGPYTKLTASPLPGVSYVDDTVASGQTYFYVATTVDINNNESAYSDQATAIVPTP
jgi:hypothetical protein